MECPDVRPIVGVPREHQEELASRPLHPCLRRVYIHRLEHRSRVLYRPHAAHHRTIHPRLLDAFQGSVGDTVLLILVPLQIHFLRFKVLVYFIKLHTLKFLVVQFTRLKHLM